MAVPGGGPGTSAAVVGSGNCCACTGVHTSALTTTTNQVVLFMVLLLDVRREQSIVTLASLGLRGSVAGDLARSAPSLSWKIRWGAVRSRPARRGVGGSLGLCSMLLTAIPSARADGKTPSW